MVGKEGTGPKGMDCSQWWSRRLEKEREDPKVKEGFKKGSEPNDRLVSLIMTLREQWERDGREAGQGQVTGMSVAESPLPASKSGTRNTWLKGNPRAQFHRHGTPTRNGCC